MKVWKKIKKHLRFNHKQTFIYLFFFLLFSSLGLGYALISTTLEIDGTANVQDSVWDIHLDNIHILEGSVTATTAPTISDNTTVSFAATLENPGDYYRFTVDVVNAGTMNAMIDSITILPTLTADESNYFSYTVTYDDGVEIGYEDALDAGTSETLLVTFQYLTQSDTSLYPTEDKNFNFSVSLNYIQGYGNRVRSASYTYSTDVYLNQAISNSIDVYDYPSDLIDSTGKEIFIKSELVNGVVTRIYVGFVFNNHIYYLRGLGATQDPVTNYMNYDSPYYETNMSIMSNALGVEGCSLDANECQRYVFHINVNIGKNGFVVVSNEVYECVINPLGWGSCKNSEVG